MFPRTKDWTEWKRRCALGACCAETQAALQKFAAARFDRNVRRYLQNTNLRDGRTVQVPARDAWHLLESHLTVRKNRRGKRYKDWLFARVARFDGKLAEALRSGVSLLMRDVVREYLRSEFSRFGTLSIDQPLSGVGDGSLTVAEMLPGEIDPTQLVVQHEYEALASSHAQRIFTKSTGRQKVALLAKELGVSLASPAVTRAAGCGSSMVNRAYRDFVKRVGELLQDVYPDDDRESGLRLALMTVSEAKKAAKKWGESEKTCAEILNSSRERE